MKQRLEIFLGKKNSLDIHPLAENSKTHQSTNNKIQPKLEFQNHHHASLSCKIQPNGSSKPAMVTTNVYTSSTAMDLKSDGDGLDFGVSVRGRIRD